PPNLESAWSFHPACKKEGNPKALGLKKSFHNYLRGVSNTLNRNKIKAERKENPGRGGRPGWGVLPRGAGGNSFSVNVVYGQQADLAQLFVSEKGLLFLAGDLGVAKTALAREPT